MKNRFLYNAIIFLILLATLTFCAIIYMVVNLEDTQYYAESDGYSYAVTDPHFIDLSDRNISQMDAMSLPTKTDGISEWAAMVVTRAMTLNFFEIQSQKKEVENFFTPQGWTGFQSAMMPLEDMIKKKKLSMTSVLAGTPFITRKGITPSGDYGWKIQMPILLSFESPSEKVTQRQVVMVLIKRVPVDKSTGMRGIAVDSFESSS